MTNEYGNQEDVRCYVPVHTYGQFYAGHHLLQATTFSPVMSAPSTIFLHHRQRLLSYKENAEGMRA